MPACFAASMTSVPAGTDSFWPLSVKLISFVSVSAIIPLRYFLPVSPTGLAHRCQNVRWLVQTFSAQVIFEFVAPFAHDTHCRKRSGVAKRAESIPKYVLRHVVDERNIFLPSAAFVE